MPRTFTFEQWDHLLEQTFAELRNLATNKGAEYSGDEDRLANFRRNGADCGLRMEQVWRIYAGKHWDAITTYVRDMQTGVKRKYSEPIDGRIDDLMVYLLLFKAMIEEERGVIETQTSLTRAVIEGEINGLPKVRTAPSIADRIAGAVKGEATKGGPS